MMRVIIYSNASGGLAKFTPAEGARLALSVTTSDGCVYSNGAPLRVDNLARPWPMPGGVAEWAETESDFLQRMALSHVPVSVVNSGTGATEMMHRAEATALGMIFSEVPYRSYDANDCPQDMTYFDAWEDVGGYIAVNMPKARNIHRDKLRALRAPLFAPNDIALRDASLANDAPAIESALARRDALRDVTIDSRIEEATTPEQLTSIIPEVLLS